MSKEIIKLTLDLIEEEKRVMICAKNSGDISKKYAKGWIQAMEYINNFICAQNFLMEKIVNEQKGKVVARPKFFVEPKKQMYPQEQYGLPSRYAVNFGAEHRVALKTEALNRFNKIHNGAFSGVRKFYGFNRKADFWDDVSDFAAPVQVLTVPDFLARTDKYFSTPIPEPKPAESHEYPHMKYGLPKYYAVHFGGEQRVELKTKAVNRYNKIYNTNWNGDFKFYGFDVKDDCWNWIVDFKEPVTLLTVIRFLALTEPHFNPKQPNITDN